MKSLFARNAVTLQAQTRKLILRIVCERMPMTSDYSTKPCAALPVSKWDVCVRVPGTEAKAVLEA